MAAAIVLTTEGFEETIARLQASAKYISDRIQKPIEVLEKIRGEMQRDAPFDSGALRQSIRRLALLGNVSRGEFGGEIRAGVQLPKPYAIYQEFGTGKMRASPYFYSAITPGMEELAREYADAVEDIVQYLAGGLA